jgi:hypothetical protein
MKRPKKKLPAEEKYDRLNDLLYQFGMNNIDHATFWGQMKQHGYGQDDIDAWCTEYYAREAAKDDQNKRSAASKGMGVRRDDIR